MHKWMAATSHALLCSDCSNWREGYSISQDIAIIKFNVSTRPNKIFLHAPLSPLTEDLALNARASSQDFLSSTHDVNIAHAKFSKPCTRPAQTAKGLYFHQCKLYGKFVE